MSGMRQELEGHVPDHNLVAPACARLLQPALHPGLDQPFLQVTDLPGVVQVHHGHPAFDPRAGDPVAIPFPLHDERVPAGPKHHERHPFRLGRLRLRHQLAQPVLQFHQSLSGQGRNSQVEPLRHRTRCQVELRRHYQGGTGGELHVVGRDLFPEDVKVARRVVGAHIDHVDQRPGPGDVPEEPQPQAAPLVGALDQPGDVRHHEPVLDVARHTEVRLERGERVGGDLGPGRRETGQQGRLPGIRQSDQRHVGDHPELEVEGALLPRLAPLSAARHPVAARYEGGVAPAAASPAGHHRRRALTDQVGQRAVFVGHDRPVRHDQHEVSTGRAVPIVLPARPTVTSAAVGPVRVRREVEHRRVDPQHHVAALAAVAAVRPTARVVGLPADRRRTRSAVPRPHEQVRLVDQH